MSSSARIDELRKKFDENPRRYFAPLANEYRKVGDLDQAIFICQEYLPQQPGHMSGHIVYGQALFEASRHEEAKAVFETALTLDPENLIALRHMGDIARAMDHPTEARGWYSRVLEADPRNEEIMAAIAGLPPDAAAPSGAPAGSAATGADEASAGSAPASVGMSFGAEEAEEAVEPPVAEQVASAEVEPSPEPAPHGDPLATAMDLGDEVDLARAEAPLGFETTAVESTPPATPHGELLDLEDFSLTTGKVSVASPTPAQPVAAAPEPEAEPAFDVGGGPTAEPEEMAASTTEAEAGAPFVTETMAQLYLAQGHREEAISIYRRLVELQPDDEALRERLDALELTGSPTAPRDSAPHAQLPVADGQPAPLPEPAASGGPTIREWLQRVFSGAVSPAAADASTTDDESDAAFEMPGATEQEPEAEAGTEPDATTGGGFDPEAGERDYAATPAVATSAIALGEAPVEDRFPAAASMPDEETFVAELPGAARASSASAVPESLDALFDGAPVGARDQAAAELLADAFPANDTERAPLRGMPAHRAADEISLERVFRGDAPARPAETQPASRFAFDQFFAGAAQSGAVADGGAEPPPPPADDLEQFNSWLDGLKKS